jgi:hypothetical protein
LSTTSEPGDQQPGDDGPAPRRAISRPPARQRAYAPPLPPAWLREVVAAAKAELAAAPAAAAGVDLGPAVPDLGPALDTRYRVDLRGRRVGLDALRDLALAPAGDPERRLPVIEVVAYSGDTLTVLAPAAHDDLHLFATVDQAAPLRALVAALEEVREPGLAERFDTRVLDRPPAEVPRRAGLSAEETAAWAASCAPGFNVVWAPPGTDAVRVVAEVAAELAGARRNVLLVSVAGAAVDRAAMETLRLLDGGEPGQVVRVGPPCLAEVADHPFVRLERASEHHAEAELARLAEIERRAAALRAEPDQLLLERAERLLAGFDQAGYEAARRLADDADARAALERQVEEQERELHAAHDEREQAGAAFDQAAAAVAEVAEARAAYQEIDQLEQRLASEQGKLDHDREHIHELMQRLDEARDAVADYGRLSPVRRATRLGAGRLRAVQRDTEAALLPAWEQVVERENKTGELRRGIEAEERLAGTVTRDEIDRRDHARGQARERLEAASAAVQEQERLQRTLRRDLERARQAPGPTQADRRLVAAAEDQDLPELAARLDELQAAARRGTEELAALAAERERLTASIATLGPDTVAKAAVVATTLDHMAVDPSVRQCRYDHVVVAEAAAALPPSVVLAATLAGRGVTLVGDPLQSGPASRHEASKVLAVSRWLLRDSLSALGLDRPDQLASRPGCTTLAPVRRLGPDTTELANRVAYQGHLRPPGAVDRPSPPDDDLGELVLVDVSRFGDLARARAGVPSPAREWWPVGALLAAAIARHHDAPGQSAALMAPYAAQLRLTEAALLDAGVGERVQAGPPSRFQGQSVPVAVLDLVEDGREPGWLARGRIDGTRHELRGLRLFDTGTARAARTYLLADLGAVERAERGPLRHVRDLCREGRISVLGAGRFLPVERPGPGSEPAGQAAALLALERSAFDDRLEAELAAATDAVWVWSPQLAARPTPVLGWLRDAAGRGCRVTVFVKPPHEHRPNDERRLAALRDAGLEVVAIYGLAERLVVVDQRRSFLGNVSVLASSRDRDEGMVVVEGARVAGALLALEQAEAFAAAPTCARHRAARCYAQHYQRGRDTGWFWTCPWCGERQPIALRD